MPRFTGIRDMVGVGSGCAGAGAGGVGCAVVLSLFIIASRW